MAEKKKEIKTEEESLTDVKNDNMKRHKMDDKSNKNLDITSKSTTPTLGSKSVQQGIKSAENEADNGDTAVVLEASNNSLQFVSDARSEGTSSPEDGNGNKRKVRESSQNENQAKESSPSRGEPISMEIDTPNSSSLVVKEEPGGETKNQLEEVPKSKKQKETPPPPIKSAQKNSEEEKKEAALTAKVYIAAPVMENRTLKITGENFNLGKWKQPQGSFRQISKINNDIHIFEGTIPVPSQPGSQFKFVNVDSKNHIVYEGEGKSDNRSDEILPGSTNFFIYKLKSSSKSFFGVVFERISKMFKNPETFENIVAEFYRIVYNHVLNNLKTNWDDAFEFLEDSMKKIRHAVDANKCSEGFRIFLNKQLEQREAKITYDELLILLIGASHFGIFTRQLKDHVNKQSRQFSLYLHGFRNFKRKVGDFSKLLEEIANRAGPDFWWIFFRLENYEGRLKNFSPSKVTESVVKTLQETPQLLFDDEKVASKVVDYLVRWNEVDALYAELLLILDENANYKELIDGLVLEKILVHKTSLSDCEALLQSDFIKKELKNNQTKHSTEQVKPTNPSLFEELIGRVFDHKLSDVVKLAIITPDHLLPTVVPIVEDVVDAKLKSISKLNKNDYGFFAGLDPNQLDKFPNTKKQINAKLMSMTKEHLKSGSFQSIPSIRLILLALSERPDIALLERPKIVDLQKSINRLPRNFFQNLYTAIKKPKVPIDSTLKPFRKGETKKQAERLGNHFDMMEDILNEVNTLKIPLFELASVQDPHVLDCLKHHGMMESRQAELNRSIEELKKRHNLFGVVYSKFSRLSIPAGNDTAADGDDNQDEEDDNEAADADDDIPQFIQVLDPKDWEGYLKDIDLDRSIMTLKSAIELPFPLERKAAEWLQNLKSCALFYEKVWRTNVESEPQCPLLKEDLKVFIDACGERWYRFAHKIGNGNVSFKELDEVIRLQKDPAVLSSIHLKSTRVGSVVAAYRDFKNIHEIRDLIGPFISALNSFEIKDRGPIEKLSNFVKNDLLKNWDTTMLSQVVETGVMRMLNEDLGIDPDRPESLGALKFISSLVTRDDESPLINWLRKKTEKDMESMGKILQGSLLEAYGQLQTLRTRIAPILRIQFKTHRDLLKNVRISEEHFAQRSGRVQPINCKFLVGMLPEIEAAIRASVISPSEDAKEKLSRLRLVTIEPHNDLFTIKVLLLPQGSLSIDEMKQAFQLLDMAVMDDTRDGRVEDLVDRARRYVGLIERLSEVFSLLFASGCITFTFKELIEIELDGLEERIEQMRGQLDEWNNQWKQVEELHILALFSRGYLLQLVDLIGRQDSEHALSVLKCVLPYSSLKAESLKLLSRTMPRIGRNAWLSIDQVFDTLRKLNKILETVFHQQRTRVQIPQFLVSYGLTLKSHFLDKAVIILNVSKELLVGSSLAAYISITQRPVEPSRILFITAHTNMEEIERFLTLWSVADDWDFFIMVHVERLSAAGATAVRQGVDRVLPERRTKLLLLAQQHHRVQSTKSLGARLGLVSDRLLDISFTTDQLRNCFTSLLPSAANLHFFTSQLPGCGKSQQAMQVASNLVPVPDYYRIPVRSGTVEELLGSLKNMENLSSQSRKRAAFLHFDVAHSVSDEFNDILLSFLIHGALYDPKKPKLGYWMISPETYIAIEFASPYGPKEFPIISYLGQHHLCECQSKFFAYDLAEIPNVLGQPVTVNRSNALITAGKFLRLKAAGAEGLPHWDNMCITPELMMLDPLPEAETFDLLVDAFHLEENRKTPTFTALTAMATFLHRHIRAMVTSMWFNESAVHLFENEGLARVFKLNVFNMLLKVANDSIGRVWSIANKGTKIPKMEWTERQRAMFLLGFSEDGFVTGMNIVGRDLEALKKMFHASLVPILQQQCLQFQELRGFKNLMQTPNGADVIINAMRSLLLLDGTATSTLKVYQLDDHPRSVPASQRLQQLTGQERGYVLTGDNITKMMFALYRIRCGLPVIAFGEAGVGKSALFRFLIQTLLGHSFEVCNVNSGTTMQDVEKMIESAVTSLSQSPNSQVFLFFDEMNTADPPVIAFFKELMLDRHCHGTPLPENLHLMAAANPYRYMQADKEAAVGLAFRFAQPGQGADRGRVSDERSLVYRVNELPLAFYDHIYDFGYLCAEAEETYIDEICQHGLPNTQFHSSAVEWFIKIVRQSHKAARAMSTDHDSAVSLRDTTRAVQLFKWFCTTPAGKKIAPGIEVAADLTIYLVYAFRFRKRNLFLRNVFGAGQTASENMTKVSRTIAKMLYEQAHEASIGSGAIALNDALCENLFALYVCVLNGIFLIIVGRPGSSKSLSVEILKLVLSPANHMLRRDLGDLPSLTELYFQCSPLSTSSGFKALFDSAQRLSVDPKTMLAMVVLDELGLADMSPEKPIKVLHSELERKSVLTSGDEKMSHYSVVALSNWVVDAAQVNRGILITRTEAKQQDLVRSAKQLAESLVSKYVQQHELHRVLYLLTESLENIVSTYRALDQASDIGGGHFFSMRDFFFCVKNFVCSVFDSIEVRRLGDVSNARVSQHYLVQSAIRNFGGHEKAQKLVRANMADNLRVDEVAIPTMSPLELIVQNIQDSAKELSIHIARHLMILNRSMIGLQLLNRYVRNKLDDGTSWNVLFGSCFPGDLQVTAVTRKLRQVEQAIRKGGVLILCHADQLFESLYMVLNQQYWAQGDVTMTQIALGPSIRSIALPDGPFRIIALQDTDVALNRELMSPAILSRFEKHELKPSHLLDSTGRKWLNVIESHAVWLTVSESVKRQKLLYGYHEESFASLALHLQDRKAEDSTNDRRMNGAHVMWMRAVNPMAMIKLERDPSKHLNMLDTCQRYRRSFILEGIDDALGQIPSTRMVVMTNTLRHLEIRLADPYRFFIIQLFDVQTELELFRLLESINAKDLADPKFCLIIQYDAVTGPIEQFQLTKYEVEQRFDKAQCRVIFIVHVDPRPLNMHWVFSFGDGWDYIFVDEVVPGGPSDEHHIPLGELVLSPAGQTLSAFIDKMSVESFKSLLLEMLGPVLQTSLTSLRSSLGQFYTGVRLALGLPDNQTLVQLLKECLLAQLNVAGITWNVVDAVNDLNFDSSSSLTEGLWSVFKHKLSNPLAHLLLVSDVWRVYDKSSAQLWCTFVTSNYPDRLMFLHSADSVVQMPTGFRCCTRPFGRLLASFDLSFSQNPDSRLNGPLNWLLNFIAKNEEDNSQEMKEAYFLDWFVLRIPPHLHHCMRGIPLSKMNYLVDGLFEETAMFVLEWEEAQAAVVAALELFSIASFTKPETDVQDENLWDGLTGRMRNWKIFSESLARLSLTMLSSPEVLGCPKKLIQSVSSIEVSSALTSLLESVEDLQQPWLGLRVSKRILIFDPKSTIKLPELHVTSPERLFERLTDLVVASIVRPRVDIGTRARRPVRQADLQAILKSTSACTSTKELTDILGECPTSHSIVLLEDNIVDDDADAVGQCSSCHQPLKSQVQRIEGEQTTVVMVKHLKVPDQGFLESLFQDYQKFMFFFERVAEIFIQQRRNHPHDIRDFLGYLLNAHSRLRVSWRFLTVIVRSVLSTRGGANIINGLLSTVRANRLIKSENINAYNFMRALLASADQDIRNNQDDQGVVVFKDLDDAAIVGDWTIERIRRLASVRHRLANNELDASISVLTKWADWAQDQENETVKDSLLLFILRFSSTEGDQTRLGALFRNRRVAEILGQHPIVEGYIKNLSPLSLGFDMKSAEQRAVPFQTRLLDKLPLNQNPYEHYPILAQLQPQWAPFIARLAYHAADVFDFKQFRILSRMATRLADVAGYLLPGIDNHPFLASFTAEAFRWYMCDCGALNCVGNCGRPTNASICLRCHRALSPGYHNQRAGVRPANLQDFAPPLGFHSARIPSPSPTYAIRDTTPAVTRLALLLNCLAMLNAALDSRTDRRSIAAFLLTLPLGDRRENEDRTALVEMLANHIVVHLDLLCQLLVKSRPQLAMTDKFRIGHLILHHLLDSRHRSFTVAETTFAAGPQAREMFESRLDMFLNQQIDYGMELDRLAGQCDLATKNFHQSLRDNEERYWPYTRLVFANRETVQLELARNAQLRQRLPFLNFVLDETNWTRKLDALQYLGEAIRFIALVRTVLQGEITQEEANRLTIRQGLDKISDSVSLKAVLLDRGRPVSSGQHVAELFEGFKQLWDRFSQILNNEQKTFLEYFECQQVDINVRPKTILEQSAPLILICAGSELPETTFSCQLLANAVEAASSVSLTPFIHPHCRAGSGRVRLSCSSAAALSDLDESVYAHVSTEEVDRFIKDHVIDGTTLQLAESFAMAAILGPAGSTIAEDLSLDVVPEFIFKDDMNSSNFLVILERRSLAWQPTAIPAQSQESIILDLEKNRNLAEAKTLLISAITHLQSSTEPLIISQVRTTYISDVLEELRRLEILTERHMPTSILSVFNRHLKLEVRHAFGLLKAIMCRMKGDDIFGGRIPDGWNTMMSEILAESTNRKLRENAQVDGVAETLLQLVNIVVDSQNVPDDLKPDKPLLFAIRQIEGNDWNGVPSDVKMEHIGHVLLLAEAIAKK